MPFHQDGPEGYPLTPPPTPPDDEYQPEGLSTFLPADSTGSFLTNWLSATEVERPARGYRLQPGRPSYNSAPPKLDSSLSPQSVDSGRRRPALRDYHTGSSGRSRGSIRSPDRFLPPRDFSDAVVQKFHANKHPQQLSPAEKLLRHDEATPDAFGPRRIATSQSPIRSVVRRRASGIASRPGGPSALTLQRDAHPTVGQRQVSVGSIWAVGGVAPLSVGVPNGRGRLISSGTNAPLYSSSFSDSTPKAEVEREKHEGRIAQALDLDRAQRIYDVADPKLSPSTICKRKRRNVDLGVKTIWSGSEWVLEGQRPILDAPNLRDDFYCSVLAYSPTCHTLAVGLGTLLYAWSESQKVHLLSPGPGNGSWLTSIAFSSTQGCKCILAYGRSDGTLTLMSLYDKTLPRFQVQQPCPIACVSWRPTVTLRPSRNPLIPGMLVKSEDLLVGDDVGNVYYYAVEWPDAWEVDRSGWPGVMTLLARISVHSQQICGLAWSNDGSAFATGGNDNLCCLFKTSHVLQVNRMDDAVDQSTEDIFLGSDGVVQNININATRGRVKSVLPGAEKHRWVHGAAVKAISFCPWRQGLVATGGGSNDKCIHFFHTVSGACLATINVAAQVTSLIWSTTRREIAATFGYAQPDHPYRVAVFSWPECRQVAAIPWEGEHRALYAIPYPGGPNDGSRSRRGRVSSKIKQEGCIIVAASDESVKFHEVWGAGPKATAGGEGCLGGSDILEGMEGIDKEGDLIR